MTSPDPRATEGATQRCPECGKLNRIPPGAASARCGACHALFIPVAGGTPPPQSDDLRARVIQGWEALVRLVPRGMALSAAVGQGGVHDPVSWLSAAAQVPRDDLEQVRLLRIQLASNKVVPRQVLTNALATLDRTLAILERTRLPE